jgi:hypothetical protein
VGKYSKPRENASVPGRAAVHVEIAIGVEVVVFALVHVIEHHPVGAIPALGWRIGAASAALRWTRARIGCFVPASSTRT